MSDSVVKLTINSQEYDEKLKRATDSLQRYVDGCRKVGDTLEVVEEETLDFVKALGSMETQCRNANGRLSEMKKSFTDWSMIYKNMTDEEKSSPFGQALKSSLDQLKTRIDQTKKDLEDVNKELDNTNKEGKDTSSLLDQLASKFGVSTKQLMGWGAAIAAVTASFELFKRNMEATETTADQYAKMQAELNSQVESFFRNMNEGSFTNFLQGLTDVANRARDAYDAMDELSSFAVRYNPKNRADMAQIDKLLKEARALQAKGDKAGAAAKTQEATKIAEQAKRNTLAYGEREYQAGVKTLQSLLGGTGVKYTEGQLKYYSDPANWTKVQQSAGEYRDKLQAYKDAEYAYDLAKESFQFVGKAKQKYEQAKKALDAQPIENLRAYNYLNTRDTAGTEKGDAFIKATGQIYGRQMAEYAADAIQARIDRAYNTATKPTSGGTGSQLTDPEKAQQKYEQAMKDYNQALEQAALETKAGTLSTVDAKKKELSAEETLWKAIGDAREIYDSDKLKQEQDKVAAKVVELGGSVNALVEEQKAAQEAARELAATEKKVSAALEEAANAYDANDLKGYIQAMNRVGGDVSAGMRSGNFSYTQSNLAAFTAQLKEELSNADVGSELFNALTAQIADAQTLANLMETVVKNGVEIAEFEPQEFFNKIFGDTPGDYIDNIDWQAIQDAINEKLKEMDVAPIELNFQTGDIKKDNEKSENATKDFKSLIGNVSTITGALKQIGVEVPEGFAKTLGVMQVITTILMAIQSLSTITATTSALKSIPIIGWFLQQGGVIHAQEGFNGIVPGNMFTGDNIPALLNSGETVLTAAQSASVANLLTSGGGEAAGASETRVESDELVLTIRNGAARRGMTMGDYLGL